MNSNETPTEQPEDEVFTRTTSIFPTTPGVRETAKRVPPTYPNPRLDCTPLTPSS